MEGHEQPRVRAIILTTQRTGSTFLVRALNSHPQIECAGEILIGAPDTRKGPYRGPFPRKLVKAARFVTSRAWLPASRMHRFFSGGTAPVRVFKAMYNQLANPIARRYLQDNKDIKVLHLERHNLLKMHVSQLLMHQREKVQTREPLPVVQVRVDPEDALARMRESRALHQRFEQLFAGHDRLRLTYEELIDGQTVRADTASRICDFLGVEDRSMTSALVKVNSDSLRDIVSNYNELEAALLQTEFENLID